MADATKKLSGLSGVLAVLMLLTLSPTASAQATSRHCEDYAAKEEQAGPACLLAHASLGSLDADAVYWSLDKYPSVDEAQANKGRSGSVIKAFGSVWLFTVGPLAARPINGEHVAQVGPILVDKNTSYDAEFLKSTFTPGMTAPIHVHSGPEAFYAVSGDSCLETPDGVQVARGPGNSMIVRGGPPRLLMAIGNEPRKGFALILHDPSLPPTTLVHHWTPKGLCTLALKASAQSLPARSADAPPAYPWHLADIWWTLPPHERLDSLSIAFDISDDVAGWPSAAERTLEPLGRGALFSRWATGQAINLDYAKGPPGTHFEAAGYEGNFVSVRNACHWHGHAVAQSNVIVNYPENGVPHAPRFAAATTADDSLQIAVTPRPLSDGTRQQTLTFGPVHDSPGR